MVTAEELYAALARGQNGQRVTVPAPTTPTTTTRAFGVQLKDYRSTGWTITASPLRATGSDVLALGTSTPAALDITFGSGNVAPTVARVDLPVSGTTIQVPPCQYVTVDAIVQAPAVACAAAWDVWGAADVGQREGAPTLTSPPKTIAASATATYQRPALAIAYRVMSPSQDFGAVRCPATQLANGLTVAVDGNALTFYGAVLNRDGALPLHPLTTEVKLQNIDVAAVDVAVQWVIGL